MRRTAWAAVGTLGVLATLLAPNATATAQPASVQGAGEVIWTRSAEPAALVPVGARYADFARRSRESADITGGLTAVPAVPERTTAEKEARSARESGQTYIADGTKPAAATRLVSDDGVINWAKCNADLQGHTLTGHVINHFEFCRWGYNTATKLNGNGQVEGQVRFLETKVGEGSNARRTYGINIKITNVTATGIYSGAGATMTLEPTASNPCTYGLVNPDGPSRTDSVLAWNGAVTRYNVTSTASVGNQTRIDKTAVCQSRTNYKINSPRGTTPWSLGPYTGGRHDSAAYLAQYGTQGAIFDRVVPSFSYSRSDAQVKAVADHVFDALYAPQLTYPQKNDKDIPGNIWNGEDQPIHRNYPGFNAASADIAAKNRSAKDRACAGLSSKPGEQCDEFPFASTKEGAGKGDGNFSVRYVPQPDNSTAGARLSAWYGQDRILDGDAYGIYVN
ncbi:NucA/NucB deoxyribonuclease domain-containing protein [Streptomyces sp. NPDC005283]|uniref:NucA/NucB deoxyribonuclease domain-containing protein n=1 Tax=Streptomyces sp. NPDC005283 TaxID=3156871 RepID=UPI0034524EAC